MDAGAGGRGNAEKRKTWALVLMGGGARGLAHIGVLAVLEEHGQVGADAIAERCESSR
jgi:predicted acylesterase/phospholipase RssA